jgi:flagellar biogenesis protein FliO
MLFELIVSPETMALNRTPLITVGYIFQLIISLALVLGLIYFSAKYLIPKLQLPSTGKELEVTDRTGLEPQVSVYVISAFGNKYLVGVGAKGVTLLDKIEGGPK